MTRSGWLLVLSIPVCAGPALSAPLTSRELDRIPLHVLPTEALERVRAAAPPPAARGPARLALNVPMPLGLEDGIWNVEGDTAIWRARVHSVGATALIPVFDRFEVPAGAELRVSDPAADVVQGPYTRTDRTRDGALYTAMVPGEQAIIELRVPNALRDGVVLSLGSLGHGVRRRDSASVMPKSGDCNVDVVCPAGNAWRNEIRSAVLLQIPESALTFGVCSGQLMNNTAQDETPYLLTANHCGITQPKADGLVVYFNYQTSACGGTPDGSPNQTQNGASVKFSHVRSDHTLLQLRTRPPAGYAVYYAGFNASTSAVPQSGAGIHHPQDQNPPLDEKRISLFDTAAVKQQVCLGDGNPDPGCLRGVTVDAFRVIWSQGVTEPGSSGSGLWDQNHRVVGVLSGGNSSCANPGGDDYFGRLEVAWAEGINQYLAPSSGTRSLAGKSAGAPAGGDGGSGGGRSGGGGGGSFGAGLLLLLTGLVRRAISVRRLPG